MIGLTAQLGNCQQQAADAAAEDGVMQPASQQQRQAVSCRQRWEQLRQRLGMLCYGLTMQIGSLAGRNHRRRAAPAAAARGVSQRTAGQQQQEQRLSDSTAA